jgi:hypothetical protein
MRSNSFLNRSRRLKGAVAARIPGLLFFPRETLGEDSLDRQELNHLISPRDLRSWQNLPSSALANFKPETISDRSEQVLSQLIEQHPHQHLPVP